MRFPFVSRALLDAANRRGDAEHENAMVLRRELVDRTAAMRADIDSERRRYDALLEKYDSLRQKGADPLPSKPPIVEITVPSSIDPIRDVIREQVRANANMPGLGAYLSNYARHLRDDRNMSPAEIERALRTWESSESLSEPVESIVPVDGVASEESDEAAA